MHKLWCSNLPFQVHFTSSKPKQVHSVVIGLTKRRHLPALVLSSQAFPLHLIACGPAVLYRGPYDEQIRRRGFISSTGIIHVLSRCKVCLLASCAVQCPCFMFFPLSVF